MCLCAYVPMCPSYHQVGADCRPLACPIDEVVQAEESLPAVIEALQQTQKVLSHLNRHMKPCFTFNKFGDCRKPDCKLLHAGGVLRDGVWVKQATAKPPPTARLTAEEQAAAHPDDDAQTARMRGMQMSALKQLATASGVSNAQIKAIKKAKGNQKDSMIAAIRLAGGAPPPPPLALTASGPSTPAPSVPAVDP